MFTGLVEDIATIVAANQRGTGTQLTIRTAIALAEVAVGDSIAVDGACLTAERIDGDCFVAVAARETLDKTTLSDARAGRRVHLERAMRLGDRLGGHLVQGHVDGVGDVVSVRPSGEARVLQFTVPAALTRYIAPKGSITLDGVSLTVNEIQERTVRVDLVPHTVAVTHLGGRKPGQRINVEVDVLAKYVERLLAPQPGSMSLEFLRKHGYSR